MPPTPHTKVLIAGVGHDRPGIVAAVTGVLAKLDCNIEDTSMTQLGSAAHRAFTWILIAALGPSAQVETLQQALTVAGQPLGLTFFVSPYQDDITDLDLADEPSPYLVTVAGLDHTGITHQVAHVLATQGVNITDLHAKRIPGDGGLVYMLLIEIQLTHPDTQLPTLRTALTAVAQSAGVEVTIRPIDSALHL
jgi:glycine cleavage system transcriptional repressor